jgi:hypothetical protein
MAFIFSAGIWNTGLAQAVDTTLRGMAAEVSKNLPMMVNSEVQATAVAASGNRIMYKYNVKRPAEQINTSGLKNEHYSTSVNGMCSTPGITALLRRGAVLLYQFYDSRNAFLFDFSITQRDCAVNRGDYEIVGNAPPVKKRAHDVPAWSNESTGTSGTQRKQTTPPPQQRRYVVSPIPVTDRKIICGLDYGRFQEQRYVGSTPMENACLTKDYAARKRLCEDNYRVHAIIQACIGTYDAVTEQIRTATADAQK